jgi:Fic family protein
MTTKDKKLALLEQLRLEINPIGLPELLKKLGSGYSERTLRRWLSELASEGVIEKFGQKKGTKYQAIGEDDKKFDVVSSCFGAESLHIIELVRRPIYERAPIAYSDDWFDAYQPNHTFYLSLEKRVELEKVGKRSKKDDPAGTYAHQIFNRLLIDLSYNSSRLEGNTYSLLDTQRLILEGSSPEGKLDEEKIMILNHKEAIRYMVDTAHRLEIAEETICTLHYLLSDGLVEPKYSGKIRDHGVRIGGSTYIPFESKKQLEIRMSRIIEKGRSIENPYEQSLFLLVHLSYLQAFSDVNKRTARLSANIPLIKQNLVPQLFNDVQRDDYASAMIAIYELHEVLPIIDLYLFSYMRTCRAYDSTIKSLEFDEVRVRYRQQRRAIIRSIIVNRLSKNQITPFIVDQASKLVKEEDRASFLHGVLIDLKEIDQSRIAGLGITPEELSIWIGDYS